MPHIQEVHRLSGEAMSLLAGITLMHAFFGEPGYGQLRQAIERVPVEQNILELFHKFAGLQGVATPSDPVNIWALILRIKELLQAANSARWSSGRLLSLNDVAAKLPGVLDYIIGVLRVAPQASTDLEKSIDIFLSNLTSISVMRDGPRVIDGRIDCL
jgi:hypothetical protein